MGGHLIYDLSRAVRDRFTSEPGMEVFPVWSPDGRSIVYSSAQGGSVPYLVRRPLSGSQPEDLAPRGAFQIARSFAPDGQTVYYSSAKAGTSWNLFRLSTKTKIAESLFSTPFNEDEPEISPDGKWIAFRSTATGTSEIYLQNLSGGESDRMRVSSKGGRDPRWRRDGQELFYIAGERRTVMSATPRVPGQWNDPILTELFRVPADIVGLEVLPDGQSFLTSDGTPGAADSLFHVIVGLK